MKEFFTKICFLTDFVKNCFYKTELVKNCFVNIFFCENIKQIAAIADHVKNSFIYAEIKNCCKVKMTVGCNSWLIASQPLGAYCNAIKIDIEKVNHKLGKVGKIQYDTCRKSDISS